MEVASLSPPVRQPDEMAEESDTSAHLWHAIDKLSPELRKVLVLTYLEGCAASRPRSAITENGSVPRCL